MCDGLGDASRCETLEKKTSFSSLCVFVVCVLSAIFRLSPSCTHRVQGHSLCAQWDRSKEERPVCCPVGPHVLRLGLLPFLCWLDKTKATEQACACGQCGPFSSLSPCFPPSQATPKQVSINRHQNKFIIPVFFSCVLWHWKAHVGTSKKTNRPAMFSCISLQCTKERKKERKNLFFSFLILFLSLPVVPFLLPLFLFSLFPFFSWKRIDSLGGGVLSLICFLNREEKEEEEKKEKEGKKHWIYPLLF